MTTSKTIIHCVKCGHPMYLVWQTNSWTNTSHPELFCKNCDNKIRPTSHEQHIFFKEFLEKTIVYCESAKTNKED